MFDEVQDVSKSPYYRGYLAGVAVGRAEAPLGVEPRVALACTLWGVAVGAWLPVALGVLW